MFKPFKCFSCHEWVKTKEEEFAFNDLKLCKECYNMLENKKNKLILIRSNIPPSKENCIYEKVKIDEDFVEKPVKKKTSKKKQPFIKKGCNSNKGR